MEFQYRLIRSRRKTLSVEIHMDGTVLVRAPQQASMAEIHSFLEEKAPWIQKHLEELQTMQPPEVPPLTREELNSLAADAVVDFHKRVRHYAPLVGVRYGRITIRNQRTRWGSCSSKGNLNFNVLLMLCPEEVRDYVVIHELCHRKEMNHSPKFWAEVEKLCPDYKQHRKWLKDHGSELMARLG